jgi:hypothetical protein
VAQLHGRYDNDDDDDGDDDDAVTNYSTNYWAVLSIIQYK